MSTKDNKKPANPGLTSTIWIEPRYIYDMAKSFGAIACDLAKDCYIDAHDVRRNVVYTNGVLALELYFKSLLVKRELAPAYAKVIDEHTIIQTDKEDYDNGGVVSIGHSRLIVPKEYWTHDVEKLFSFLSEDVRERVTKAVVNEKCTIKNEKELVEFLSKIKEFFVAKRYAFEFFIEAVPADSNYIYTLIPVIKGVEKALG